VDLGHFNARQLADYLSGLWTPDQQREIEIHLSQCDACTMLARQVYVDAFVIDNWTAKAKAEKAKAKVAAANATRSAAAH
jgi:anti-sigma factor RsiW